MADPRLRISAWLNNTDVMVLQKQSDPRSPPVMTKDAEGKEVPQLRLELLQQARGLVDDFTVQRTMNNEEKTLEPAWDPLVLGGDADKCQRYYRALVTACHREELQCLLSYTMMAPEKGPSRFHLFNDWLAERAATDISPEDYAQKVVGFLDKNVPECDGLSFDIEGLRTGIGIKKEMPQAQKDQLTQKKEELLKKMRDRYERFLRRLAELLNEQKKILGVATAGLISEKEAIPGITADDGFRLHQYTMAKDRPNMLIRPMIYDNFPLDGSMDPQKVQQAVDFTIKLQGLAVQYAKSVIPPSQFQVGIKTIPGNMDTVDKKTGRKGPRFGGFITDVSVVRARCKDFLRPQEVGLALFPTSASFWKEANAGLNENAPLVSTYGNPMQAPMHKEELDRVRPYSQILPQASPIAPQAAPVPSQAAPVPPQAAPIPSQAAPIPSPTGP